MKSAGFIVSILLTIHAGLLAYGAYVHSPTYNEPAHLVAGISYWKFGRFDVYNVNPPLVRMIAAAPVLLAGCETDWKSFYEGPGARPEMAMGSDFCTANGFRTCWLMTLARWACIPFSLLGGYFVYRWSRELYGTVAGLLSLTLWCFCPNIVAHGQLITSDAAATSLGLVACYSFWKWLKNPTWWSTILSGAVLGVAELAKTTLVIFYPLWPILWLIYRWPDRKLMTRGQWGREFSMLFARICIGLYVINLGYGFEGSGIKLGDYTFVSKSLAGNERDELGEEKSIVGGNRFKESWFAAVPVPLPKNYVLGIDLQRKDFESYHNEFYLGGEWSKTGWWYYYLYALAIKVPVGTWLLILIALLMRFFSPVKVPFRDEFFLLTPGIVILTFVSSQTGMNEHMRYVLPIFPFFYIWAGRIVLGFDTPTLHNEEEEANNVLNLRKKPTVRGVFSIHLLVPKSLAAFALLWSVGSSLWIYPHSLAYFNEIVGGPSGGHKHLLNSNIDWGQDLLKLKRWIDSHPEAKPIKINCFGAVAPKQLEIECLSTEQQELSDLASNIYTEASTSPPAYYAISINRLHCYEHQANAKLKQRLKVLVSVKPIDMIGYSIYVFNIGKLSSENR